ncbi:MAG: sauU 3 [Planctomycetaceae bacterium]|nr:sauU 3 [Planctomycetaceae bacterium]
MRLFVRTLVLFWLCSLVAVAYSQRNLGVAETTVQKANCFTIEEMAWIQSSFFWSYALLQVPAGWLGYRWGPRFGLSLFCLAGSLAIALTSLTHSVWLWCLARLLLGIGQAAALPCVAEVLSQWYSPARRGSATGAIAASMQVGAMIAAYATGPLLANFSLTEYFWILAVPGILWSIGFYSWFRNHPAEFSSLTSREREELPARINSSQSGGAGEFSWFFVATSPVLWLVCGQQCCRAAGYVFFGTWFPRFLQETRGLNVTKSGTATACMYIGVLLGSLFGGAISDLILRRSGSLRWARQGVAAISLTLCGTCIAGSYFVDRPDIAIFLMSLGAFCSGVGAPAAYTVTIDISGKHVATVFGVMNTVGNLGAAAFAQFLPKLFSGATQGKWDLVIAVFSSLYITAAVCWIFVDPSRHIFPERDDKPELLR